MKEIVCFGEVLWDVFPDGSKIIGGAPLNVALHWVNLGGIASIISKVGKDLNGQVLINNLEQYDKLRLYIDEDEKYQTGVVEISLDDKNNAEYNIKFPSSWDYIGLNKKIIEACKNADAFIYGSLSSRTHDSKETLHHLLQISKYNVFDINLRPPFYSKEMLMPLLYKANLIKLNEEEIIRVLEIIGYSSTFDLHKDLKMLSELTKTESVCVTLGKNGAVFLNKGKIYHQESFKVNVLDTVGAGDSFLSALVHGVLNSNLPEKILKRACAIGAMVASSKGATPNLDLEEIDLLVNNAEF